MFQTMYSARSYSQIGNIKGFKSIDITKLEFEVGVQLLTEIELIILIFGFLPK